jgi:hypothetical protein
MKAWQPIILLSTGILLVIVAIKLFILSQSDFIDKLTAVFAVSLFLIDQVTR